MFYLAADEAGTGTPLWLGVVTLVIAVLALAVAYWQASSSIEEARRARPRVRLDATFGTNMHSSSGTGVGFFVHLANRGREATHVESIFLARADDGPGFWLNGMNSIVEGQPIPCLLEGHSSQSWVIRSDSLPEDASSFDITVHLGHGEAISERLEKDRLPHRSEHRGKLIPRTPRSALLKRGRG